MAPQSKLVNHQDKEEIIGWITQGVSVREIERRLAERYPRKNQQHLRVAFSTIQSFKKNHLNLRGKMLEDIKEARKETNRWVKQVEIQQELEATGTYQEAIKNLAQDELDTRREILKVWQIIESQIEHLFDKLQENKYDFVDKDVHKVMQGYLNQFMNVIDQYKKYEEGYKETIDVNINVNVMKDQVSIMREAIRETLAEVDPELTMVFMSKLNPKMKELTMRASEEASRKHALLLDNTLGVEDAVFE